MWASFLVVFLCIGCGKILRHTGRVGDAGSKVINAYIINIAMPAVALTGVRKIGLDQALGWPVLSGWLVFTVAVVVFFLVGRLRGWTKTMIGAVTLTAGLSNTSFVGFPLLEAFYGRAALGPGVVVDQLGSFSVLATLATIVAHIYSGRRVEIKPLILNVIKYPPFVALAVGMAIHSTPIPDFVLKALERIADTLIPLALVSIGMQLRLRGVGWRRNFAALASGLFFKLIAAPVLLASLIFLSGSRGFPIQVTIMEAAMPPMIMGSVLAVECGLDPDLANLMAITGIPLSMLTIPVWWYILRAFA